jgi:hypothetical protein
MKEICPRKHKCLKQCWESCEPCRQPVAAELTCKHEAVLPCNAVDSYKCIELCENVSAVGQNIQFDIMSTSSHS